MLNIMVEKPLSLATAASDLKHRGKPVATSTLYRWATSGCRGVVLETTQLGGCKVTSMEALQRFTERLNGSTRPNPPHKKRRTAKQRLAASKAAERRLVARGA
jgi:Protein of unknown function (DUF1580)